MKINLTTTAFVALLGLALASVPVTVQAQTSTNATTAPAAPAPAKKSAKTPYKGSITAIDASSVTVASKEKTLVMAITPKTTFKKDKAAATLADFAVGDAVTGSYSTDSTGALTANSLHKKTPKPAAAPAATPAAQ